MPDLEFKLTTDLTPIKETVLTANFEEVEAQLRELMAPYEKMVLREEDIAEGKNVLARIRKVEKTIDDYRKSIKKDFTAPLAAFEEKCKALTAVCYESETNLSEQINKYVEQRKAEKLAALRTYFDDNIGTLAPYLRYEQIENPKWGNVTFSVEQAQQEIAQSYFLSYKNESITLISYRRESHRKSERHFLLTEKKEYLDKRVTAKNSRNSIISKGVSFL